MRPERVARLALAVLASCAAYLGLSFALIRRRIASAAVPILPFDVELRFPGSGKPLTLVVVGDSTAQGIGARDPDASFGACVARALAEEGRDVRLVNLGVEGALASEVLESQVPRVPALEPDVVLVSVGGNDVIRWTPVRRYVRRMSEMLDALVTTGARVAVLDVPAIITMPILPLPLRVVFDRRARRMNRELRGLVEGRRDVALVGIYEVMRRAFTRASGHFCADGHHPSPSGYTLWAEEVGRELARLEASPR